jgi:hypothetical protein
MRGTAVESLFGLDLTDRRRGKVVGRHGPPGDAADVAIRELLPATAYRFHLAFESLATAGVDGGNRAVLKGVDVEGAVRRVGLAAAGLSAELRTIEIEGKLDLRWVARELARKPIIRGK